jgi:hypothetical protein
VPSYRQSYLAHYRTLLREVLDPATLEARAVPLHELIREDARTDPNPLYAFALFDRGMTEDVELGSGPGSRPVPGLLRLARLRSAWLSQREDMAEPDLALARHERLPDAPGADEGAVVTIEVAGGEAPARMTLIAQVDGRLPLSIELARSGMAGSATIPPAAAGARVRYYVRIELADGRAVFFPPANWTQPWTYEVGPAGLPRPGTADLVLNELQADNRSTIADPYGGFDDWLELYNRGSGSIALEGYYLSDDPAELRKYALAPRHLAVGEHVVVWCDGNPEQGADHAPFKLSKEGESLYLSGSSGVVDYVAFGRQATDRSHGRASDGADAWIDCETPSPGRANHCQAASPTPGGSATPRGTARLFLPLVCTGVPSPDGR